MRATEAYVERLRQLDADGEQSLLTRILEGGYDQGCFLRPNEGHLIPLHPGSARNAFECLAARETSRRAYDSGIAEELRQGVIDGSEPGYVILTQRCDLLAALAVEPFVELAHARAVNTKSDEGHSAIASSARLVELASADGRSWVIDLRKKALLPKDLLDTYPALQPVPLDRRSRFRLRLGQRFARDALPEALVAKIQRPLMRVVRKPSVKQHTAFFSEWLLYERDPGRYQLIALFPPEVVDRAKADDAYEALQRQFPESFAALIDADLSGALSMEDLSFLTWLTAKKINLDEVSWHPRTSEGQAQPSR